MPLGTGIAFAHKYREDKGIAAIYMGDGAVNQGQVYESFNMAALWKLPSVFVIENNQYAMGTPLERTSPLEDLSIKAKGYGMPGDRFEGHDVEVVQQRLGAAIERARSGEGPTFIEIQTYRFRGHSMSDPAKYRSRTELEQRKQRDPIAVVRERLLGLGVEESTLDDVDLEVDEEIDAAVAFADESEPAREDVMMSTVLAPEADS